MQAIAYLPCRPSESKTTEQHHAVNRAAHASMRMQSTLNTNGFVQAPTASPTDESEKR